MSRLIGRRPRAVSARRPDMAEAGKKQAGLGLPGGDAAQWPLQRYGRFMPLGTGEPPGPGLEAGMAPSPTWKVFDSNEESGYLVLTIVISGHFFISQGQTLLEGFSLIGSKNWLKIVRRMDCLLFGTTIKGKHKVSYIALYLPQPLEDVYFCFMDQKEQCSVAIPHAKNKSRMFRVQFSGESKQQALEHCSSCVQSLAQYVTVQAPDGNSWDPGPLRAGGSRGKDCVPSIPLQHGSHQKVEQQQCAPAITSAPGGRASVARLAQSLLASEELPLVYEQSAWNAEELGPFLRFCLMDQNFPAFVEEVEKELRKLMGLRN